MAALSIIQFVLILAAGYGIAVLATLADEWQERRSGR